MVGRVSDSVDGRRKESVGGGSCEGCSCRREGRLCDGRHRQIDVWVVVIGSHEVRDDRNHDRRDHLYLVRAHCALCPSCEPGFARVLVPLLVA